MDYVSDSSSGPSSPSIEQPKVKVFDGNKEVKKIEINLNNGKILDILSSLIKEDIGYIRVTLVDNPLQRIFELRYSAREGGRINAVERKIMPYENVQTISIISLDSTNKK
jgi:hypothetical protein